MSCMVRLEMILFMAMKEMTSSAVSDGNDRLFGGPNDDILWPVSVAIS